MNLYRQMFPQKRALLVVIHAETTEQALRNAKIAFENGADGLFLINHRIDRKKLYSCYRVVRNQFPDYWIGLNWLGMANEWALKEMRDSMDGLWLDNIGVNEYCSESKGLSEFAKNRRKRERELGCKIMVFGGVAFKYQKPVTDLVRVTKLAIPYVDVITTSGEGTGIAADPKKLVLMREAAGDHPIALASGVSPENVHEYAPYIDCFIVATEISKSETELDPLRVRKLAQIISL